VIVLGIVGPIASGKSVVLEELAELGAVTLAADEISRDLLKPGSALLGEVAAEFGAHLLDAAGHLKRAELAHLIFTDDSARQRLNAIMHPPMLAEIRRRIEQARAAGVELMAIEAAVLEQIGALELADKVVMVTAPRDVRTRRLRERDGLDEDEATRRLQVQEQIGLAHTPADFSIDTNCSLEATRQQVRHLWQTLNL